MRISPRMLHSMIWKAVHLALWAILGAMLNVVFLSVTWNALRSPPPQVFEGYAFMGAVLGVIFCLLRMTASWVGLRSAEFLERK